MTDFNILNKPGSKKDAVIFLLSFFGGYCVLLY